MMKLLVLKKSNLETILISRTHLKDGRQKTSVSYTPTTLINLVFHRKWLWGWFSKLNLYKGLLDDVRIYSRVISDDEIDTIYNLSDSEPIPGGG